MTSNAPERLDVQPRDFLLMGVLPARVEYVPGIGRVKLCFVDPRLGPAIELRGDLQDWDESHTPVQDVVDGWAEQLAEPLADVQELEDDGVPWRLTMCPVCSDTVSPQNEVWMADVGPRTCSSEQCQDMASRVAAQLLDMGWRATQDEVIRDGN